MSAFVIALLFSIGSSTWVYTKFQRNSGNNTPRSLEAAGISGLVIFVVVLILLKVVFP